MPASSSAGRQARDGHGGLTGLYIAVRPGAKPTTTRRPPAQVSDHHHFGTDPRPTGARRAPPGVAAASAAPASPTASVFSVSAAGARPQKSPCATPQSARHLTTHTRFNATVKTTAEVLPCVHSDGGLRPSDASRHHAARERREGRHGPRPPPVSPARRPCSWALLGGGPGCACRLLKD